MAPKSQSKKSETPAQVATEVAPVAAVTPAPQKVSKKSKKEEVAAPAAEVVATPVVEATEQGDKKERRTVTKETLHVDFEALL